jgi:hypothetical protein
VYETESYPSGAELSHASYTNLAIEGELAVRLGDGVRRRTKRRDFLWVSLESVSSTEIVRVFPVIELHNYVFRSATPALQELVANSGLHAGVVLPATEGVGWRGEEF